VYVKIGEQYEVKQVVLEEHPERCLSSSTVDNAVVVRNLLQNYDVIRQLSPLTPLRKLPV